MTEALPIDAIVPDLLSALRNGPLAVLVAPPGAGKTTRVPLALLDAPWRGDGRIIMLEPRRLAARAAARRMAETRGETVGETIGYRVRLDSRVGPRTRIEVVTEGVFTRMLLDDPELHGIAAVLFDEFHERSIDGDLGLALALDARALRPELRLVVMSATLDAARLSRLLDDAPVIVSEGRSFPVDTRYLPGAAGMPMEARTADAVRHALADEAGSILAFLPGEGEITRVAERLAGRLPGGVALAPLYGRLSAAEQDEAIRPAPPGRRKVVLATAIAQTSLTIEGIRIVIDSGWTRLPAYDPGSGLTRLETRRVSRAAAEQRRGRAGRIEAGICYRLWPAVQDASLPPFDPPEILSGDLAGLVLDLAAWGVADPALLRFPDPPPPPAWQEAVSLLQRLGALDAGGRLTVEGRALAKMPLHPRLAHMIRAATPEGEAGLAAEIAVLLAERGLGGDEVDLDERLRRLRRDTGRRAEEARLLARRWGGGARIEAAAGRHLARAFPERVAQAAGRRGQFRLVNGRQAVLDAAEALAGAAYLAIGDLTGAAASGRIRTAAAISRDEIETLFADRITTEELLSFDPASGSVRARRVRRLGELRLADAPVAVTEAAEAARLLALGAAGAGIDRLPWTHEQLGLRQRASFLRRLAGEAAGDWPDLSDEALARDAESWLAPFLIGRLSLHDITPEELGHALAGLLPWSRRAEIDRLLPSHFDTPAGSRLPIDYEAENGPAVSVRVQELFGLDRHPAIADGRLPLLLVLLSPAHRPIQTTRDLPRFWRGSWADVAKDLRGRYPRHPWPEDPLHAPPTSRAKPRPS